MIKDKCERCYEDYEWVKTDEDLDKYEDKLLMKLLRGERLTEEERLDVIILNLLDKHSKKENKE